MSHRVFPRLGQGIIVIPLPMSACPATNVISERDGRWRHRRPKRSPRAIRLQTVPSLSLRIRVCAAQVAAVSTALVTIPQPAQPSTESPWSVLRRSAPVLR
jgi:hypothetical protein